MNLSGRLLRLIFVLLISFPFSVQAQEGATTGGEKLDDDLFGRTEAPKPAQGFGQDLPPLERPVDPALYHLGPNDQLLVSLPSINPVAPFPVVVSVDNTVLLPRGIIVDVGRMTLGRFRRVVDSIYKARSKSFTDIAVTLAKPRSIFIRVKGDVVNPGRYLATAADRVTTAIDMANYVRLDRPGQQLQVLGRQPGEESPDKRLPIRRIVLRHNDGSSQEVDLIRYQAFGNDQDNPTLREGDEITVRRLDLSNPTISIAQAVNNPTLIPFHDGDNALLLIRLAAGLRPDADPRGAFVARHDETGMRKIPVNPDDSAAMAALQLMPGDRLFIPTSERRLGGLAGIVTVQGEVRNPGAFPIISGVTKLSEVMNDAGGVTANAAINGAYIKRLPYPSTYDAKQQLTDPVAGIATSSLNLEDTTRFKYDISLQQDRVAVDFADVLIKGDKSKDVVLQNGDRIVIPGITDIYVRGRVRNPGYVSYTAGATADYYVEKAGGLTEAADASRVTVSKFGPSIWLDADRTMILPGDEIYVPGERDTPPRTSLEVAGTLVAITSGLAALTYTIILIIQAVQPKE